MVFSTWLVAMHCQRAETFTFHYNFLFSSYNRHLLSLFMKIANLQMLLRYLLSTSSWQCDGTDFLTTVWKILPMSKKKKLYFIFSSIVVLISCACTKTSPDFRVVHVPPLKALTIQISMMKGDFSAGGAYWAALLQSCQWLCSNLSSLSLIIASLIL